MSVPRASCIAPVTRRIPDLTSSRGASAFPDRYPGLRPAVIHLRCRPDEFGSARTVRIGADIEEIQVSNANVCRQLVTRLTCAFTQDR